MVNKEEFTKKLEKIMAYYGLTATAFADELDFNRSTISHLLSGRNKPSLDFVIKLLQKFPEVEMSWLVFGKGNFPSTSSKPAELKKTPPSNLPLDKDLFSRKEEINENQVPALKNTSSKTVDKIVVLYSDGSFNIYEN